MCETLCHKCISLSDVCFPSFFSPPLFFFLVEKMSYLGSDILELPFCVVMCVPCMSPGPPGDPGIDHPSFLRGGAGPAGQPGDPGIRGVPGKAQQIYQF